MDGLFIFAAFLFLVSLFSQGTADLVEDKQALLDFVNYLPPSRYLINWKTSSSVCKGWSGITCNTDNSRIIAVHLPGVGFHGQIPPNTLSRLSELQTLNLRSNALTGSFPSDFSNLKNLSYLYLQFNNFSGPLPSDFSVWKNLTIINLSNNGFSGIIPFSISNLTKLKALNLANNSLSGQIPPFHLSNLQQLNLANNNLTGIIPKLLLRFPNSSFSGNNLSIKSPLISPVLPPASNPSLRKTVKLSESTILGVIVGGGVMGFVAIAFLFVICCSSKKGKRGFPGKLQKGEKSSEKTVPGSQDGSNGIVFFESCNYAFDLEDLLRASAEVLGKGTYGTSYKASLEDTTTMVVKRLKEVGVGKREFEQQMEVVGRIRHENIAELKAYYYSKDEKLMVYDYYSQGSVSAMLHGNRGEDRVPLDWETRMRIAIGTARGISFIHTQNSGKLVHGNIKSSNIFLNHKQHGCVSDLGVAALMNPVPPSIPRGAGYRAPEVVENRKASQPSDVYSFGVLLLELLTGKSPLRVTGGNEVIHLVRWVQSVVREEWTAEVFDLELLKYPNIEEEMVEMLQIALSCVIRMPDKRPKMVDVMKMVEDIRRVDTENRPPSETKSGGSTPSPQVPGTGTSSVP